MPQYFAPGVAGDHGEPIAQYIGVGDFLVPNNLTANVHGNGYADPKTLAHFTNSAQLGRIDPDTGLQENLGPALIRSLTFSARRYFPLGFIEASFSRADARDPLTGIPVPEAPRLIWDATPSTAFLCGWR